MFASDSDPPLQPEGLTEEEQRSFLTPICVSDRGCTEPLLTALLRLAQSEPTRTNRPGTPAWVGPRKQAEQIRQGTQVKPQYQRPYPIHL